jgi:hypothetical protein
MESINAICARAFRKTDGLVHFKNVVHLVPKCVFVCVGVRVCARVFVCVRVCARVSADI